MNIEPNEGGFSIKDGKKWLKKNGSVMVFSTPARAERCLNSLATKPKDLSIEPLDEPIDTNFIDLEEDVDQSA